MTALILSNLALFVGLFSFKLSKGRAGLTNFLDSFQFTAVLGLILVHLIPHSTHDLGLISILFIFAGYFIPKAFHKHNSKEKVLSGLVIAGFLVHSFFDGAALAIGHSGHGSMGAGIMAAIIFHRIPFGMVLGSIADGVYKLRSVIFFSILIVLLTCLGFFMAESLAKGHSHEVASIFEAFIVGALLHLIKNHYYKSAARSERDKNKVLGSVAGLITTLIFCYFHPFEAALVDTLPAGETFMNLILVSSPALVLAFLISGIFYAFIKPASLEWIKRGSIELRSLRGVLFGIPLPICSCGVLPIHHSLVKRGVPTSAGLAFLIATPEIGLDAILISIPLLGGELTLMRVGAAFVVAFAVSVIMARIFGEGENSDKTKVEAEEKDTRSFSEKTKAALNYGFKDSPDDLLPWILLGLFIASFCEPLIHEMGLSEVPSWLVVPIGALIGMPIYVCASGSTPIAAVLIHKGLSPGAALAFLLTGPATNVTSFGYLSSIKNKKFAMYFATLLPIFACICGWIVDFMLISETGIFDIHSHSMEHHGPLTWISFIAFSLIAFYSFIRLGAQGWVLRVADSFGEHSHGRDEHGNCMDHDHDEEGNCITHDHEKHDQSHGHENDSSCCSKKAAPVVQKPKKSCCGP